MKRIGLCFVLCFLFICQTSLPAQTAEELEAILEAPAVSYGQAALFVLGAVDGSAAGGPDAAFYQAMERGWLHKKAVSDDPATMGGISFLMMRAFGIKGSLLYRIFPGPRYAFRTMASRSLLQGTTDPAMKVSGERFLLILGNVLSAAGGEE